MKGFIEVTLMTFDVHTRRFIASDKRVVININHIISFKDNEIITTEIDNSNYDVIHSCEGIKQLIKKATEI